MRLKPVEKLARELIVPEAATYLLMTPEGMKLRREARIIARFDPHTLAVLRPGGPVAAIKPDTRDMSDMSDPKTWRCAFRVMHWVHPEDDGRAPKKKSGPRPRLFSYDDIVAFLPKPRRQIPERCEDPGAPLARRIEALSRVLDKPERAIRRIARFLAGLPREALEPLAPLRVSTWGWYHGRAECAFIAFTRARIPDFDGPTPEPG